jgi:diguanylate cyclase (GGDEF)-like protein
VSSDQIVLLVVGLLIIAAVAMTVAWVTASTARRQEPADRAGPGRPDHALGGTGLRERAQEAAEPSRPAGGRARGLLGNPTSTRQVARAVALLFLASAAIIVALTGAWPATEAAVFTLLAAGTLLVVVFMDLVPPSTLGRWRRPAEALGAVVFLAFLTALTGAASSPFVVGFFLVVAGTALSTEGRAPLAIALLSAASVALVGIIDALDGGLGPEALAWVGFMAMALILLADIATAAARAQRHARDEALRASRFDSLTGLYNRAFFFTTMEQEIRRSDRMGRDFTMLMLDLDDLKPVNDTFGHQWGDRFLKAVADTIRRTIRFTDAAARYGGDEFVVLLPETDATGGYVVAEKLRRDIAALALRAGDRHVRSSASLGLVTYPHDGATIEQLVSAADVAMYESKRRGKNRIVGYQLRTERVAAAMGFEGDQVTVADPPVDARTGGDPAPWEGPSTRMPSPPTRAALTELGPTARPAAALPVQPDARDRRPLPVEPAEGAAATGRTRPPVSSPSASGTAPGATPPGPSAPRPRPPVDGAASSGVPGPGDPPWLTKTGPPPPGTTSPPRDGGTTPGPTSRPTDEPGTNDASSQRPAADLRSSTADGGAVSPPPAPGSLGGSSGGRTTGGSAGRSSSRSEEIRGPESRSGRERPYIALPIEPWEPPERPKG